MGRGALLLLTCVAAFALQSPPLRSAMVTFSTPGMASTSIFLLTTPPSRRPPPSGSVARRAGRRVKRRDGESTYSTRQRRRGRAGWPQAFERESERAVEPCTPRVSRDFKRSPTGRTQFLPSGAENGTIHAHLLHILRVLPRHAVG